MVTFACRTLRLLGRTCKHITSRDSTMEPSTGAPPSEGSRASAPLNPVHSSGSESLDQSRNASGKRPAQHERYHNAEIKRRKTGAQQAAKVQEKATQLVQQLAAPRSSYEHSGTLAKAEHRQDGYNQSIDEKPWAGNTEQTRHSTHPTAGLTMRTGHYTDLHSPDHKSVSASSHNTEPADSSGKSTVPAKPVEQTKSDRARRSCPLQAPTSAAAPPSEASSQSEADSASHAIQACKEFSNFQKNTRNSKDKSDMASTEERQRDEQTNQHHQQNDPEDAKRLPTYQLCQMTSAPAFLPPFHCQISFVHRIYHHDPACASVLLQGPSAMKSSACHCTKVAFLHGQWRQFALPAVCLL